jgi:uncharacterized protein YdhG (YjbR/CyaY superfamily)
MTPSPIDAYLTELPEPQRSTLTEVRTRLRELLPHAEECISYGMPAFRTDGRVVAGFAGFKRHCSYFPHSGSVLAALGDALHGYDAHGGTLRFAVDQPLPVSVLRLLVHERLKQESDAVAGSGALRSGRRVKKPQG